ncbi:unnamed protein product [Urochloa decumbens]|uniref:F-box domain-containing protein n=1 Tax=Urochloa decumbens TaxID=240449 RepID=A0ABC9B989_9POAL
MPPRKRGRKGKAADDVAPAEDDRDYISTLPDDALEHILSFVPAQDAVRTCVLARRWRHVWKSAKGLHIITPGSIEEVREFVDHLLLIRAGSTIDTFELRTQEGMFDEEHAHVKLWIRHALACKAQALQFEIYGGSTMLELWDVHLLFASQHLTSLEFAYVRFTDCFLNFSSCPALQHLRIRKSEIFDAKRISCQSLKHLSVTDCNSRRTFRTRIQAPNLASLCLDEAFQRAPGLSVAKNLSLLSKSSNTFIFRRDLTCCPTFSHLKNLLLNEYWCMPDVCALACILEHSPVLEKLTLQLFSKGPKHQVEIKRNPNPKVISAAMSQHLKIVEVKCEVVDDTVLNVLKFLSKHNMCFTFEE